MYKAIKLLTVIASFYCFSNISIASGPTLPKTYNKYGYKIEAHPLNQNRSTSAFTISFSDRKSYRDYGNFLLEYKGGCEERMTFSANYLWTHDNKNDFSSYVRSKDLNDLPVVNMVRAMQEVLVDQCANARSIGFQVAGMHSAIKNSPYVGTMREKNGWRIETGDIVEDNGSYTIDTQALPGRPIYYRGVVQGSIAEIIFWSGFDKPLDLTLKNSNRNAIALFSGKECFTQGAVDHYNVLMLDKQWVLNKKVLDMHTCTNTRINLQINIQMLTNSDGSQLTLKPANFSTLEGNPLKSREFKLERQNFASEAIVAVYSAHFKTREINLAASDKKYRAKKVIEDKLNALFDGKQAQRFVAPGIYKSDDLILIHTAYDDPNFSPHVRMQSWLYHGMFNQIDNETFYAKYFIDFIRHYEQSCSQHIIDPIKYTTRLDDVTKDGFGNEISRKKGETYEIVMSNKYLEYYKQAVAKTNSTAMLGLIKLITNRSLNKIQNWVAQNMDKVDPTIPDLLTSGCMSVPVQTVYQNLWNRSSGNSPHVSD